MSQFRKSTQHTTVTSLSDLPSSGSVTVECCRVVYVDDKIKRFGDHARNPGYLFNLLIADTTSLVDVTAFCYNNDMKLFNSFFAAEGKLCRIVELTAKPKEGNDLTFGRAVNPIQLTAGGKTVLTVLASDDHSIAMGTKENPINPLWVKASQESVERHTEDRSASASTTSAQGKRGREDTDYMGGDGTDVEEK